MQLWRVPKVTRWDDDAISYDRLRMRLSNLTTRVKQTKPYLA
jgi:hypothetical protein